jgi:hypothetical protein
MRVRDSRQPELAWPVQRLATLAAALSEMGAAAGEGLPGDNTSNRRGTNAGPPVQSSVPDPVAALLIRHGFAEHASGASVAGPPASNISGVSRIVPTPEGVLLLKELIELESDTSAGRLTGVPKWDSDRRELSLNGVILKRFRRTAPNQERLLQAFEEDGWPHEMDDPLPRTNGVLPGERLRETIKRLNRSVTPGLIRFGGDGSGERVVWRHLGGTVASGRFVKRLDRPQSPLAGMNGMKCDQDLRPE